MRLPPRGSPYTGPLPPPGRADSDAVELTQLAPATASARAHRPRFLRLRAQAPLLPPMEGSSVKEMVEEEDAAGIWPSPAARSAPPPPASTPPEHASRHGELRRAGMGRRRRPRMDDRAGGGGSG
ncbi:unnamed protein product [Urochloa humidicola]